MLLAEAVAIIQRRDLQFANIAIVGELTSFSDNHERESFKKFFFYGMMYLQNYKIIFLMYRNYTLCRKKKRIAILRNSASIMKI